MEVYFPGDPDARPMPQTNDELVAFVRESKDEGVDIIKLFLSGWTTCSSRTTGRWSSAMRLSR